MIWHQYNMQMKFTTYFVEPCFCIIKACPSIPNNKVKETIRWSAEKKTKTNQEANVVSKFDSFHLLSYNLFYFLGFLHSFNIYSRFFLLFILYFYIQYWYFKWRWRLTVYLVFRNAYHCVELGMYLYKGIIQLLGAIKRLYFHFLYTFFFVRFHCLIQKLDDPNINRHWNLVNALHLSLWYQFHCKKVIRKCLSI